MNNNDCFDKEFMDAVNERLNQRVKEKIEKDGSILEHDIYDIFKEEAGLKNCAIPYISDNILKNYAVSQVNPSIFHNSITDDVDFRKATDKIKRRYSHGHERFRCYSDSNR